MKACNQNSNEHKFSFLSFFFLKKNLDKAPMSILNVYSETNHRWKHWIKSSYLLPMQHMKEDKENIEKLA